MDAYQLVVDEIDTKHNILLQKLSSGSIKDYSEYKYICGVISGLVSMKEYIQDLQRRFEENVIKANIIYIDRLHDDIAKLMAFIQKSVIVPTKVIFRNPKNASNYPFDVTEFKPEVKPRARKKSIAEKEEVKDTTENKKTTL